MPRMPNSRLAVLLLGVLLGACGGGAAGSPAAMTSAAGGIEISAAWVRPAAVGAETAAYFTITNHGPADTLIAVHAPIAASSMIHQAATDSGGMTGMSMVSDVPIPAGGRVELQPGGMHVMLTGLTSLLAAGTTVELELAFEHAGIVRVTTAVREG